MTLHVELDGDEIVVTKPRTDMMTAYRKAPDRPNLVLTPKLARAHRELASDKRVSSQSVSGSKREGARARVDRVSHQAR